MEQHKDSCNYSVDLSKLFITLSVAGIGFVVSQVISADSGNKIFLDYLAIILFGISTATGLVFLMGVIGHINRDANYDVYTTFHRIMSLFQIIMFLAGIGIVAWLTFDRHAHQSKSEIPSITIRINNKIIEQQIVNPKDISIEIQSDTVVKYNVKY